jgi:hypothetical protein
MLKRRFLENHHAHWDIRIERKDRKTEAYILIFFQNLNIEYLIVKNMSASFFYIKQTTCHARQAMWLSYTFRWLQ